MRKVIQNTVYRTFAVDKDAWTGFEKAAESYGVRPAELLRELVGHVDAAVDGIEKGKIQKFDGDISRLIRREFPQLSPLQLRVMGNILIEAAIQVDNREGKE